MIKDLEPQCERCGAPSIAPLCNLCADILVYDLDGRTFRGDECLTPDTLLTDYDMEAIY